MKSSATGRMVLIGALLAAAFVLGFFFDRLVHANWTTSPAEGWLWVWHQSAYYGGLGWFQIGGCLALALGGMLSHHREWTISALGGIGAVAVSGLATQGIKHLMGRPRPRMNQGLWDWAGPVLGSDMHSFPSGHAAISFALAVVLAHRFPRAGWAFYIGAAFIAIGRVINRAHFPLDIIGGAALGIAVGWLAVRWVKQREVLGP